MRLPKRTIRWVAPILAAVLSPSICGQASQAGGEQEVITWFLPLQRATERLQQRYGKPITYEDPLWRWTGDLQVLARESSGRDYLTPREHTFILPAGLTPATRLMLDAVVKMIEAYHLQNPDRTRYRVLDSAYGLHVVPSESHDRSGRLVPGGSLLDTRITVGRDKRTASEHIKALCAAVTAAAGNEPRYPGAWFDQYFAANGYLIPNILAGRERPYMLFEWGASDVPARDALIDLLQQSATTMTWIVNCNSNNAMCWLNLLPLTPDPARAVVAHDRCHDCRPIPKQ